MSRSLNKVQIIGNLGSDPDIRTTAGGTRVANLSVATTEEWQSRNGQRESRTEWHRVVMWNGLAEIAEKFLTKGSRVYIEGTIRTREYLDRQNVTRYVTEIIARELIMLDSRERVAVPQADGDGQDTPLPFELPF